MRLNRLELALMNNPVRSAVQRWFEAPRLLRMGGPLTGGRALEIGCGRGVGVELILDRFAADHADAFDVDPRMVASARRRLSHRRDRAQLSVADAAAIPMADERYDAVFDFGIVHHVPEWPRTVREIARVLKPGGRLYAEEVLAAFVDHPVARRLFDHPLENRFDASTFASALADAGLSEIRAQTMLGSIAWFVATKPSPG